MSKKQSFEDKLVRLNDIISKLEAAEIPLTESISLFEEGACLVKECVSILEQAEQKVSKIIKDNNGMPVEISFSVDSDERE